MLQTCAAKQLDVSQNQRIRGERNRQRQRTVATVRKRKLQYFAHMIRAQNLCTLIFEGRLDGARGRERSRRRRGDDIKDRTGKTMAECRTTARDR